MRVPGLRDAYGPDTAKGRCPWRLRLSAHRAPARFETLSRKLRPEGLKLLDCLIVRLEVGDDRINDVDAGIFGL